MHKLARAVLILIIMPILLVGLTCLEASPSGNGQFKPRAFLRESVLNPGEFYYLNITLEFQSEDICVIAYSGNSLPEYEMRSTKNYYRWEYNQSIWRDAVNHDSNYIDVSKCSKINSTYSFFISISKNVNPGIWTIKIFADNKEVSSNSLNVVIGDFCLFFSTIVGVFQPCIKNRNFLIEKDLICADKEKKMIVSEKNIDETADQIIKKQTNLQNDEASINKKFYSSILNEKPLDKQEIVNSNVFTYPRSKLKLIGKNGAGSLFFNKNLVDFCKNFFVTVLVIFLIICCFSPMIIAPENDENITIINVHSYPFVGDKWTVMFTTIGRANLTITAVNGINWSDNNNSYDLRFLELKRGNESLNYEWISNSVFISNFSSDETCYEISRVLTPGVHTLMFTFGNDVAYAFNDAVTNTSVDNISPYNVGYSPYDVTATGNSSLDNVTLWYRWSADNSSWDDDGFSEINNVVDDNTCNVDGSADKGTETNFANAQDASPDADVMTSQEADQDAGTSTMGIAGSSSIGYRTLVANEMRGGVYTASSSGEIYQVRFYGRGNTVAVNVKAVICDSSGVILTNGVSNAVSVSTTAAQKTLTYNAGSRPVIVNGNTYWIMLISDGSLRLHYSSTSGGTARDDTTNNYASPTNPTDAVAGTETWRRLVADINNLDYELDMEYQFNNIDYNYTNEYLCFYLTGSVTENLLVDYWSGSWTNLGTISGIGWSNFTATGLTSSTYNIRIRDQTQSNDVTQTSWTVDCLFLHTYTFYVPLSCNWSIWSDASNPDVTSPWGWEFVFANGTGYYEFYSLGQLSGYTDEIAPDIADAICYYENTPPSIEVVYPENDSSNINLQPNCRINANDYGDTLTVYWYENTTGSWVLRQTDNDVVANSEVDWTYTQASIYSTTYWWKVVVNDSISNVSGIYHFSTNSLTTFVNPISPYFIISSPLSITATGDSGLDNITLWYRYSSDNSSWGNRNTVDSDTSNVDGSADKGTQTNFPNAQDIMPDEDVMTIQEADQGSYNQVTYQAAGNGAAGTGSSITPGYPSGLAANDLMILHVMVLGTTQAPNTPTDWTLMYGPDTTGGSDGRVWVFYKFSTGAESGTLTVDGMGTSAGKFARIYSFRNVALSSFYESGAWETSTGATISDVGVTTSVEKSYAVNLVAVGEDANTYVDFAGESGGDWTELVAQYSNAAGADGTLQIQGATMATTGTINGGSYGMGANDPAGVRGFVLKPLYTSKYVIDFEYNWTTSDYNGTDKTISIYAADHTGSETLNVNYRNGASWTSLGTITTTGWNNFTASGMTSEYYTIQMIGSSEVSDNSQDTWTIDCMFLFTSWSTWSDASNPDTENPWQWNFNFPDEGGYYEFYSIGKKAINADETSPAIADAICHYNPPPTINSYDLVNSTGSKLNNATGLINVNKEYTFTINITDKNRWTAIQYINITAWYDFGSESNSYNQTAGGNLNMFLQYVNISGTAQFNMLWPNNEVQLITSKCNETILNSTTRIINISFKPLSQVRWASSNNTWNATYDVFNDLYSWNFNITVTDFYNLKASKNNEYGVYKFSSILPQQNWIDVIASPGFSDTSNIVTITYSSNYNFNISIYFEENLINTSSGHYISIQDNVYILANADLNDDITEDIMFMGVGKIYAVDIYNDSGIFNENGVSQTVNVQFDVYIPFGTISGRFTAHVNCNIKHD